MVLFSYLVMMVSSCSIMLSSKEERNIRFSWILLVFSYNTKIYSSQLGEILKEGKMWFSWLSMISSFFSKVSFSCVIVFFLVGDISHSTTMFYKVTWSIIGEASREGKLIGIFHSNRSSQMVGSLWKGETRFSWLLISVSSNMKQSSSHLGEI